MSTEQAPGAARVSLPHLGDPRRWADAHCGDARTRSCTHVPTRTHDRDTHTCLHVHAYPHAQTRVHTDRHTRADMCVPTDNQTDTHTPQCTHTHTGAHTHTHTDTGARKGRVHTNSQLPVRGGPGPPRPHDNQPLPCTRNATDLQGDARDCTATVKTQTPPPERPAEVRFPVQPQAAGGGWAAGPASSPRHVGPTTQCTRAPSHPDQRAPCRSSGPAGQGRPGRRRLWGGRRRQTEGSRY